MNTYAILVHQLYAYRMRVAYRGSASDSSAMYAHLNTIERTLTATRGTADIEIIENGESRWIEYRAGRRTDVLQ